MMAMSPFQICKSRSPRLMVPGVLIGLLMLTYLLDWWAIRLETHDKYGNNRFRIVARINWYWNTPETTPKPTEKQVSNEEEVFESILSSHDINKNIANNQINLLPTVVTLKQTRRPFIHDNSHAEKENNDIKPYRDDVKDNLKEKDRNIMLNVMKPVTKTVLRETFPSVNVQELVKVNIPVVHVPQVNCRALAEGVPNELIKAKKYQESHYRTVTPDKSYIHLASNCTAFIKNRHYAMEPLSQEEAQFPIAYSLLMFKDIEQVERLLRAIYRPQNFYCVHIDSKAPSVIWSAMRAIVNCFDNIFLSSRSVDVQWGKFSVLEPELVCMQDLWKYKWKYFINLTGQEFPLQTNWDIVKILKSLKGANNAEGTVKRRNRERTMYVHTGAFAHLENRKGPAPIPVTLTKGSVHIIVQRGFVDYLLHDPGALAFRKWVMDTGIPDETFFSSLIYSPNINIPGAYKGEPETDKIDEYGKVARNPFLARFKNWGTWPFNWDCAGERVRMVCIFGVGDLKMLLSRKELFANKFHIDYQPLAYDCLEEFHFNRTRDEVLGLRTFDTSFYEKLDIVNNHVI